MPIAKAIAKYGKDNFSLEVLCHCDSQESLDKAEKFFAVNLNTFSPNGYNLKAGNGPGAMSEEAKKKISISNTGKKATLVARRKMSASHIGHISSHETRAKLRDLWIGVKPPEHVRLAAIAYSAKNYVVTFPDGHTERIRNMKKFCKENNLSNTKMCEVVTGRMLQHKAFRAIKLEGNV